MNTRITPIAAITIILVFGSILFLKFWATGKSLEFEGPNHIHTDTTGNLYIQIGEVLLKHDQTGQFVEQYDLNKIGIEDMIGDFAVFNNGDILIRRGSADSGLLENLRRFQRQTNTTPQEAPDEQSGLFRCNLIANICSRFGDGSIDMNSAFHLFIDPRSEDVYATDTSRHVLRKFSSLGEQLASANEGFKFPNQVLLHDQKLYIADTNHHQIHLVTTDTDNFGQSIETHSIRATAEQNTALTKHQNTSGHTWPTALLPVGEHWWVNNMTRDMRDGGVYIYDRQWQMRERLLLPDNADPVSMASHNNSVLISDMTLNRVYRFDQTGQSLDDFTSDALRKITRHNITQKSWYEDLADYSLYAFFGLLAIGFIIAFRLSSQQAEHSGKSSSSSDDSRSRTVARALRTGGTSLDGDPENSPVDIIEEPFLFTGNARDYFGIWAVNILLIIITAGLYSPWAKVRTKRYFYGNTLLDNSPFDYLADPIAILKGWAIGLGVFAIYSVVTTLLPFTSIIFVILFFLLLPWLVIRSMAFRMHNSSYRNLRFRFNRKYREAIKVFVGIGLLVPLTLGLILPTYIFRQKKFIVENSFFGTSGFDFKAAEIKFYEVYGIAILIIMSGAIVISMLMPALTLLMGGSLPDLSSASGTDLKTPSPLLMVIPFLMLVGTGFFYLLGFAYINTKIHNLIWNSTSIADNRFLSTLEVKKMMWLYFSNALAIMFSLGLMIPWARIRMARYRIDNLALAVHGDLDNFIAAETEHVSAAGEEIGEMFDFDVGL